MIKLIASDIDGTLIPDSTPNLYPEIVEEIKSLTDRGILFCGASGRQLASIRSVFREVEDKICYIAENGAHLYYKGKDRSMRGRLWNSSAALAGNTNLLCPPLTAACWKPKTERSWI